MPEPAPQPTAPGCPLVRWIGPTRGAGVETVFASLVASGRVRIGDPLESSAQADLTVVSCPAPQADPASIERLAADVGCPMVQLLGVWCEGEGRTGQPPTGVERVFWHAWPEWWAAWSDGAAGPQKSATPATASALVHLVTPRRDDADAIGGVLRSAGYATAWTRDERDAARVRNAAAVVWCGTQLDGSEADRLAEVRRVSRPAPVMALLDFPRPETVAAARAIGADRVLGRPCDADTLAACVHAAIARRARRTLAAGVIKELVAHSGSAVPQEALPAAA
ncbi:MAG: hypothetical protein AAF805_14365 [Planctomycetota bacterium]